MVSGGVGDNSIRRNNDSARSVSLACKHARMAIVYDIVSGFTRRCGSFINCSISFNISSAWMAASLDPSFGYSPPSLPLPLGIDKHFNKVLYVTSLGNILYCLHLGCSSMSRNMSKARSVASNSDDSNHALMTILKASISGTM